jgi:hypothetical protein
MREKVSTFGDRKRRLFHGKKILSVTADAVPALPKGELYECKPSDAKELPLSGELASEARLRGFINRSSFLSAPRR